MGNSMPIYLNNAATTYPKPPAVVDAVCRALSKPPVEPGRSGHGVDLVAECRKALAKLFHVNDARHVSLLPSATYALNAVILGLLGDEPGSHAVTTALEHNSVLRPLEHLRHTVGLQVSHVEPGPDGRISASDVAAEFRENTRLVAVSHASNVTGCIQPVFEVAVAAAAAGIPLLIDASQTAGAIELDYRRLPGRVFVATAGHKGLYGPAGVGVLIVPDARLPQTVFGGTGVRSENPDHPADLPLRHEAGTMNLPGIAGLLAGVEFVMQQGVQTLGEHRNRLVHQLRSALRNVPDCRLSPLADEDGRMGIVSFSLGGWTPEELGKVFYESFGIEVRTGLHCAPRIHATIGAAPLGNVRVSVGVWNTEHDIHALVQATEAIAASCAV